MGRQLKSISNGTDTYSYTYNEDGIRTSKTVNGVTTNYVIDNKLIKAEYTDTYSIIYWYDDKDSIVGFFYTDKTVSNPTTQAYIYTKNAQGDVTGILNSSGTKVASYSYDSWGNVLSITGSLSSTIGTTNPIRYRGYYIDNETGYYYLQSRYYNSEWCRFINADDINYIGVSGNFLGVNAYIYCENKPIILTDDSGFLSIGIKIAIGIVGIAAAIALTVASGGALFPSILATLKFVAGSMAISMAIGGLVGYLQNGMSGLKQGLLNGAVDGFMWGGITAAINAVVAFIKVMKTVKTIRKFTVCKKHLSFGGGSWEKFNTSNQNTIRDWIRKAVLKGKPMPNKERTDSFAIVYKIGKVIGKKGEKFIKVVYDKSGNIWTAFPVKK